MPLKNYSEIIPNVANILWYTILCNMYACFRFPFSITIQQHTYYNKRTVSIRDQYIILCKEFSTFEKQKPKIWIEIFGRNQENKTESPNQPTTDRTKRNNQIQNDKISFNAQVLFIKHKIKACVTAEWMVWLWMVVNGECFEIKPKTDHFISNIMPFIFLSPRVYIIHKTPMKQKCSFLPKWIREWL